MAVAQPGSGTKVTKKTTFSTVDSLPLLFHDDSHKTFVDPCSHPSTATTSRGQNQEISAHDRRIHSEGDIKQCSAVEEWLQHLKQPAKHERSQKEEAKLEIQQVNFHGDIPLSKEQHFPLHINNDGGNTSESVENRVENNRPLEFLNSVKRKEWETSLLLENVVQEPRWIAKSEGPKLTSCTVVIVKQDAVTIVNSDDAGGKNAFAFVKKVFDTSNTSGSLGAGTEKIPNDYQKKEISQEKGAKKVGFCVLDDKPRLKQGSKVKKKKQGTPTVIISRRHSRTPTVTNLMREIRKMSLASQDAREERKKAQKLAKDGTGQHAASTSAGVGQAGSGPVASAKRAARRLTRRRKRREEEYTDKDRAAAVTLGSRDIKQSLKAKKKRERKLHISIDLLHSEEFLSSMFFCEASYQMRVKQEIKSALTTLNKALDLQPAHKGALVARSQCHLKLGDAAAALQDAQTSFKGNDTFIMGLYQYAEALYNLGQFEKALIAYHRGYRLRKQENFRIGIQKSQEAIRRAIGDTTTTQMEDLADILPVIDELEAKMGKTSFNREDSHGGVTNLSELSSVNTADPQDKSITSTITLHSQANTTGTNTRETSPCAIVPSAYQSSRPPPPATEAPFSSSARNPTLPVAPLSPSDPQPDQLVHACKDGISSVSSVRPRSSQAGRVKEKYAAREVLGQMYFDKDYLIKFLHRPDVQGSNGASAELRSYATDALKYLETREGFWRQQNPLCSRKNTSNAVSKGKPS